MKPEELSSQILFTCPYFKVEKKELLYPNGYKHNYYLESAIDFVLIVAEQNNKFLMVKQYRIPEENYTIEFPAGGISKGELPEISAKRELVEETGYIANNSIFIGKINPIVARSKVRGYIYYTNDITHNPELVNLDQSEFGLESIWISKKELEDLLLNKDVCDAVMLSAWALLKLRNLI
jgi:ADP-ribose pyrophosphatase